MFEVYFYLTFCFYMNMIAFLLLYEKYKKIFGYSLFHGNCIRVRLVKSSRKMPSIEEIAGKHCAVESNSNEDREEIRRCKKINNFLSDKKSPMILIFRIMAL
jgi:hypothetical protein